MQSITPLLYDHELGKRKTMSVFGVDAVVGGDDIMMMMFKIRKDIFNSQ